MIVFQPEHKVHQWQHHSPRAKSPRQVSFFMFWANEQPHSRVSAMALRHKRRAMSQEGEGSTTKQRGTKSPTSPRDRTSPPQIKTKKKTKQKPRKAPKRTLRKQGNLHSRPTKDTKCKEATERRQKH